MYCKNCKVPLKNNSKFCSNCGAMIEKEPSYKKTYRVVAWITFSFCIIQMFLILFIFLLSNFGTFILTGELLINFKTALGLLEVFPVAVLLFVMNLVICISCFLIGRKG